MSKLTQNQRKLEQEYIKAYLKLLTQAAEKVES